MELPMLVGEDSPSSIVKLTSSLTIHLYTSPPLPSNEFQLDVVDKWARVGFINGRILPLVLVQMDLAKANENKG